MLDEVRTAHADRTRAITNSVVFEEMKAPEEIEEQQQEYAAQTRDRLRTTAETAKSVIRGENIRFSEVNDTNLRIFQRMGTSRGGLVAAGDGSTRSLYDLAGANVDVFRKNISTMAKKEVEKVEKELQQSIPTM